jgi:hypothetical protein
LNSRPGRRISRESAGQIPVNNIDRFLDGGDQVKLQRMPIKQKLPAPSA